MINKSEIIELRMFLNQRLGVNPPEAPALKKYSILPLYIIINKDVLIIIPHHKF